MHTHFVTNPGCCLLSTSYVASLDITVDAGDLYGKTNCSKHVVTMTMTYLSGMYVFCFVFSCTMYRMISTTFPITEATNTSAITATSVTVTPPMTGDVGASLDDGIGDSEMNCFMTSDISTKNCRRLFIKAVLNDTHARPV